MRRRRLPRCPSEKSKQADFLDSLSQLCTKQTERLVAGRASARGDETAPRPRPGPKYARRHAAGRAEARCGPRPPPPPTFSKGRERLRPRVVRCGRCHHRACLGPRRARECAEACAVCLDSSIHPAVRSLPFHPSTHPPVHRCLFLPAPLPPYPPACLFIYIRLSAQRSIVPCSILLCGCARVQVRWVVGLVGGSVRPSPRARGAGTPAVRLLRRGRSGGAPGERGGEGDKGDEGQGERGEEARGRTGARGKVPTPSRPARPPLSRMADAELEQRGVALRANKNIK